MKEDSSSARGARRHKQPRKEARLSRDDKVLWRAFQRSTTLLFTTEFFDVEVGETLCEAQISDPRYEKLWGRLCAKRIDVVLWNGPETFVVEIKPRAGMVALGQCLTYRFLYSLKFPERGKINAVCLCGEVDPDVAPLFALYEIQIWSPVLTHPEALSLGLRTKALQPPNPVEP